MPTLFHRFLADHIDPAPIVLQPPRGARFSASAGFPQPSGGVYLHTRPRSLRHQSCGQSPGPVDLIPVTDAAGILGLATKALW